MTLDLLKPPEARGTSVARVMDAWYVACASDELRRGKPLARTILGVPVALFRDGEGSAGALLDRCPHRNVPLSEGRVAHGDLECAYHGWRFDRLGRCTAIPTLDGEPDAAARKAPFFPVRESQGHVWVWPVPDGTPEGEPFRFELDGAEGYTTVRQRLAMSGSLHAAAENALDVPHTKFLHGGLFRTSDRKNRIEVVVTRTHDRVEAEYLGEPRPTGLVGRILAPRGGVVTHVDRFFLPSIVQVEYRLGKNHILVTSALTPESDFVTRFYGVVSFKLPLPGFLVAPILEPIAMSILKQDARMLEKQTANVRRFGGEQYVSTEVDVLGPHILRLLRAAERGKNDPAAEPFVRRFHMEV